MTDYDHARWLSFLANVTCGIYGISPDDVNLAGMRRMFPPEVEDALRFIDAQQPAQQRALTRDSLERSLLGWIEHDEPLVAPAPFYCDPPLPDGEYRYAVEALDASGKQVPQWIVTGETQPDGVRTDLVVAPRGVEVPSWMAALGRSSADKPVTRTPLMDIMPFTRFKLFPENEEVRTQKVIEHELLEPPQF